MSEKYAEWVRRGNAHEAEESRGNYARLDKAKKIVEEDATSDSVSQSFGVTQVRSTGKSFSRIRIRSERRHGME